MKGNGSASIRPAPSTQTINVYDRLREDFLSGRLEPGRKLQMRFLTEAYQVGQTPLREALNRLTAEGLVDSHEQRGFYVTQISRAELEELTKTRCWVESLALREAMAASTPQWEEAACRGSSPAEPNAAVAQCRSSSKTIRNGNGCTGSFIAP